MLAIIFIWGVFFFVFLSFGRITAIALEKITQRNDSYSAIDKIWMGVCFIGTILLFISIIFPINSWILAIIITVSASFYLYNCKGINIHLGSIKELLRDYSAYEKCLFSLVFFAIIIYALSTPLIYDEGLYHLQSMQWTEKYGAILGLGNIHGRLGFNSSFLLLSTLFNYQPDLYTPTFALNSFCLLVFSFWITNKVIKSESIIKSGILFVILLISLFSLGTNISSTSTDILPNIFIMYLLLKWVLEKNFLRRSPYVIVIVSAFCITLKLSSAILILAIIPVLIELYKQKDKKALAITIGLGIAIAIPWLIRFVILTGYLVYPFPSIDLFSVDWKIPLNMVVEEKDLAYAWGRIREMDANVVLSMSFVEWFPVWLKNLSLYNLSLYLLAFISPFVWIVQRKTKETKKAVPWMIAIVGVVFSLLTAPDFRFVLGYLVCASFIPFLILEFKKELNPLRHITKGLYLVALVGIIVIAIAQVNTYQHLSKDSVLSLLYKPQSTTLLKNQLEVSFKEYKLNNTTIFIPQGSDQCFDQSIPCSPSYNTNLEMRGAEIKDGFRIKK